MILHAVKTKSQVEFELNNITFLQLPTHTLPRFPSHTHPHPHAQSCTLNRCYSNDSSNSNSNYHVCVTSIRQRVRSLPPCGGRGEGVNSGLFPIKNLQPRSHRIIAKHSLDNISVNKEKWQGVGLPSYPLTSISRTSEDLSRRATLKTHVPSADRQTAMLVVSLVQLAMVTLGIRLEMVKFRYQVYIWLSIRLREAVKFRNQVKGGQVRYQVQFKVVKFRYQVKGWLGQVLGERWFVWALGWRSQIK